MGPMPRPPWLRGNPRFRRVFPALLLTLYGQVSRRGHGYSAVQSSISFFPRVLFGISGKASALPALGVPTMWEVQTARMSVLRVCTVPRCVASGNYYLL